MRFEDRCLGVGATGSVWLGMDELTGAHVAIKEVPFHTESSSSWCDLVENEISIMASCVHDHLVRYVGVVHPEAEKEWSPASIGMSSGSGGQRSPPQGAIWIVMEWLPAGSVTTLIRQLGGPLPEHMAASFTRGLLNAVSFLHDRCHVCHRDIKGENLLVSADGRCKLADYGASRRLHTQGTMRSMLMSTSVGTAAFMAPEVAAATAEEGYTKAADIWSVGCTVHEMLTGRPPSHGVPLNANPLAIMYRLSTAPEAVAIPDAAARTLSPEAASFVACCCVVDPTKRPTAAALITHPWLQRFAFTTNPTAAPVLPAASPVKLADGSPRTNRKAIPRAAPSLWNVGLGDEDDSDQAMRQCMCCHGGFALFSCDSCREVNCAHRLCAACWDQGHRGPRGATHRKRPLLSSQPTAAAAPNSSPGAGLVLANGLFVDVYDGGSTAASAV